MKTNDTSSSSSVKKTAPGRCEDNMDDDSDDKDSKRKSRNISEKKRRDQFNLLVSELSAMISSSGRKMDKSTVLKSTIAFLKNHNEVTNQSRINEIQEDWKPAFLANEEFTHLVLEAVDGFIIVFSTSGQIYYVSESVTSLLGHLPSAILNMSIYDLASEDERTSLYNVLMNPAEDENPVSFSCHLQRGGIDCDKSCVSYELVHFVGYFRSDEDVKRDRQTRYRSYTNEADSRLLFVGTGRLQTPQLIKEMPPIDSNQIEFTSRHSLEWKFLFLDHRAPPIIGYLPFELLGTSGYEYYHVDDLDKVVSCHEEIMQKGEGTSCYYRFLTKGQQWIWLQTKFYITYHQWNSKPEFVVCTHRVVNYVDIMSQGRRPHSSQSGRSQSPPPTAETDCAATSTSADSPASKHSVASHHSSKRKQGMQYPPPQFLEPPQYVGPVVVQQMEDSAPDQLQADLQRKQAELQAMIGQQQQELRRVSEQLLMAKLGLLSGQNQGAGAVSSTTTSGVAPSVIVPHQGVMYTSPDSNTQNK